MQKTSDGHFKSDGRKDPHDPSIDRCVNCHNDVMEHNNGQCPNKPWGTVTGRLSISKPNVRK